MNQTAAAKWILCPRCGGDGGRVVTVPVIGEDWAVCGEPDDGEGGCQGERVVLASAPWLAMYRRVA